MNSTGRSQIKYAETTHASHFYYSQDGATKTTTAIKTHRYVITGVVRSSILLLHACSIIYVEKGHRLYRKMGKCIFVAVPTPKNNFKTDRWL